MEKRRDAMICPISMGGKKRTKLALRTGGRKSVTGVKGGGGDSITVGVIGINSITAYQKMALPVLLMGKRPG